MHRAVQENSGYISMLKRLSQMAEDVVAPPLTDQELETWQAEPLGLVGSGAYFKAQGADYVSHRWNQLYPDLARIHRRLNELGLGDELDK